MLEPDPYTVSSTSPESPCRERRQAAAEPALPGASRRRLRQWSELVEFLQPLPFCDDGILDGFDLGGGDLLGVLS